MDIKNKCNISFAIGVLESCYKELNSNVVKVAIDKLQQVLDDEFSEE